MKDFSSTLIFGYGGLIFPQSRSMTLGKEVEAFPIVLSGFERFWGHAAPQYRLTTVSLKVNHQKTCTGVLFPVTPEQLKKLDLRESGYYRVELLKENIHLFKTPAVLCAGAIYTYVTEMEGAPSIENPITQSEVDAILTGCLNEYGSEFARELVRTTGEWNNPWLDDRKLPRYPWSLRKVHFAPIIDQILREIVPIAFNNRIDL